MNKPQEYHWTREPPSNVLIIIISSHPVAPPAISPPAPTNGNNNVENSRALLRLDFPSVAFRTKERFQWCLVCSRQSDRFRTFSRGVSFDTFFLSFFFFFFLELSTSDADFYFSFFSSSEIDLVPVTIIYGIFIFYFHFTQESPYFQLILNIFLQILNLSSLYLCLFF